MNTLALHTNGPIPGLWNDGQSAASHPVALFHRSHQGDRSELRICPAGSINDLHPLAVWPWDRVRELSNTPALPLRLADEPDTGRRLTVEAGQPSDVLRAWMRAPQAQRRARSRRRWLMGTAAVWILCLGLFFGGPALFSFTAGLLPQSWEEHLGKSARDNMVDMLVRLPGVRGANEKATQDPSLKQLLARLEHGAPTQGYAFDLLVLDADFVNAFALPGGYMLVSTGLIKACQSPDELAGVLAHEMAHITGRHGTQRLLREQAWALFARMLSGSDSLAVYMAGSVITSAFDRDEEREADAKGVERLAGAGINPMGLADFFARLEKEEARGGRSTGRKILSYVASHPELAERRENIRRAMQEAGRATGEKNAPVFSPAFSPAMSPKEWQEFRAACGIPAVTSSLPKPSGHARVRPAA
jgi:Zn-dependent protease with chaperone function